MAKKPKELSPAEKELSARKAKLDAAKDAHSKADNEKNKAAVTAAEAAHKEQLSIVNRERFVRVGGNRATKARDAIRNLSNVAAPRSYSYTEADVVKLETMLNSEVSNTVSKLRNALTKGASTTKSADTFAF
jgi:hypothetical protein